MERTVDSNGSDGLVVRSYEFDRNYEGMLEFESRTKIDAILRRKDKEGNIIEETVYGGYAPGINDGCSAVIRSAGVNYFLDYEKQDQSLNARGQFSIVIGPRGLDDVLAFKDEFRTLLDDFPEEKEYIEGLFEAVERYRSRF